MRWISVCFKIDKRNISVHTHSQALGAIEVQANSKTENKIHNINLTLKK